MDIGILKETYLGETRAPLIPFAVGELVKQGGRVVIQSEAGLASGFVDQAYQEMGASIVYSAEEAISRSELVLKVYPPSWSEYQMLEEGQILFSFLQLSHATKKNLELLIQKKVAAIGFEAIEEPDANRPILTVMSEIAGKLTVPIAAHYLQVRQGGKGILLGGLPGVPPAVVVVLGAGVVGSNAALKAAQMGAQVMVLDKQVSRLKHLEEKSLFKMATAMATPYNISRFAPIADVLIGAVFIEMEATPHLMDEELVKKMKPRSVFLDISIDQGGCSTTSRPTTIIEPVYVREGVTHFCVPNIPALVPRTATIALSNILLPYLEELTQAGPEQVLRSHKTLRQGFYTYNGFCLKDKIAQPVGLPYLDLESEWNLEYARR
jgi:alanine dehydrogenase